MSLSNMEILITMKTITLKMLSLICFAGVLATFSGCNKNDSGASPEKTPSISNAPTPKESYPAQTGAVAPASSGTVSGTISIDPRFANKIDPNAVLFISAKPAEGPQVGVPPLASQRVPNPKFPLTYTLTQQDVIMPGATLSGQLNIVAKLMKSGAAGPMGPGDIEGKYSKNPVTGDQKSIDITLDTSH
jgi:cytochrome c-type biogenesis protein CcmH